MTHAKRGQANHKADSRRDHRACQRTDSQRISGLPHQNGCIGAKPQKSGVTEADLTTEAADQVQAEGEDHRDTDAGHQRYFISSDHADFPNRPCGRIIRMTMRKAKAIASRSMKSPR